MDQLTQFLVSLAGGGLGAGALVYVAGKVITGAVKTAVEETSKREQARLEADLRRQTSHYTLRDERQADAAAGMIVATLRFVRALQYVYNPLIVEGEPGEKEDASAVYSARHTYLQRFGDAFLDAWHQARAYLPAESLVEVEKLDESAGEAYAALNDYLIMTRSESELSRIALAKDISAARNKAFGAKNFDRWDALADGIERAMREYTVPSTPGDKKGKAKEPPS